jgi:large subunit ribosomal protein L18e
VKKVRSTNPELITLIRSLRKRSRENQVAIWRYLADRVSSSRRKRIAVNVSRLNRHSKEGETLAVPGKVLGAGIVDHPINVAAFAFSEQARSKILKAKGKCSSIHDLMEKNPKGTNVKVIG